MTLPLVSVAIPAYNHAEFIEQTLASVVNQTYPELELVVFDDGSTDNTYDIIKQFLSLHSHRFRRVIIEKRLNIGVSANSNACIAACNGEWVHLLGSDDVLYPSKVERIQNAIAEWQCADLALVHADVDYIDESGIKIARPRAKSRPPAGIERKAYHWLFLQKHFIFNPTLALHRQSFLDAGGFDPTLPLEDLDCWLRLSTTHTFGRVPEILAAYRKHPGNASRRRLKMLAAQIDTYAIFLESHPGLIAPEDVQKNFRDNVGRFWRRIRRQQPWHYLSVLRARLRCRHKPPEPSDYRRFSAILKNAST